MTQLIGLGGQKNANFTYWDTNQQYRTGDMVVYNNEIYSANENIAVGTAWNPAQWTLVLGGGSSIPSGTNTGDQLFWTPGGWTQGISAALQGHLEVADDAAADAYYASLTPPVSPTPGALYFNTTDDALKYYDGTAWQAFSGGGSSLPTGTSPWQILAWNYDGTNLTWQVAPNPVYWNLPQNSSDSAYETAVNAVGQGLQIGSRYFNTADKVLRVYDGSQWADAGSATTTTTVAALGTKPAGFRSFVTDSAVPRTSPFGTTITGGGINKVPVWTDGVAWYLG